MNMAMPSWNVLVRQYESERHPADRSSANFHPLQPNKPVPVAAAPTISTPNSNRKSISIKKGASVIDPLSSASSDPLSGGLDDPLSDPLNAMSIGPSTQSTPTNSNQQSKRLSINEHLKQTAQEIHTTNLNTPWQIKKAQILSDYALVGNITLGSSAINEFSGSGVEDGSSGGNRQVDKYSQRLAALEKRNVSDDKVSMTQQEYMAHINKLSKDLTRAWANDERVATLKVAIQLAKSLADTNMPQFYPSMFVTITDELDRFGEMVYARLKTKAEDALNEGSVTTKRKTLPVDFTAADVPSSAKDTCRNWFYKTACIRELLPRIYIETTLLKCYRFLTDVDFPQILSRIASIIRGLGDPLVSLYARTYLIVVGNEIAPSLNSHGLTMLQDIFSSFKMLKQPFHVSELVRWKVTHREYMRLMSPGIEWTLKCVGKNATREIFQGILALYRDQCNDSTVLKHIIDSFDGSHYAHGAMGMSSLIKSSEQSWVSHTSLFASLGAQLAVYPPPEEQKIPLLNDVWKLVSKTEDIGSYIECCASWLDCVQRHYSEREMLILLSDLSIKVQSYIQSNTGDLPDIVQRRLESIIITLIGSSSAGGPSAILTSDNLLKILDAFTGTKRVTLCKEILEAFRTHGAKTNDAVLINTMFDLGRTLHDSVDSLSPDGEIRYIATLLGSFIEKIDFGRDLEQQLNMYVECRAIFCNLDLVKDKLILCVCELAVKAYKVMKGKHNKKTSAFTKACLAYSHITIPSITDVPRKLSLLLHCANVALLNQCLPQTDTFLKQAVGLIPEMPLTEEIDGGKRVHTEEKLACFVKSLLSFMVVAPGHPDHGPFYIVQGLLNALPKYQWQPTTGIQTKVYIDMLSLLCTYAQKKFPYHIPHVESNDQLYGGAPEYMKELGESITTTIEEIMKQLTALGERTDAIAKVNQSKLVLDLVNQLASRMDLNNNGVSDFLLKLIELSNKSKGSFTRSDIRYLSNTIDFVKIRASIGNNPNLSLVNSLKLLG